MKTLFNKYEAYNEAGGKLSDEVMEIIDPLIKKWANKGYRVRDIEAIIMDNVEMESVIVRATRTMHTLIKERKAKKRKAVKEAKQQ